MCEKITFRCRECGYEYEAQMGRGPNFPTEYEQAVDAIRKGKYGEEWQELFESTPGAIIDTKHDLFVCGHCGNLRSKMNLSIYEPNDPIMLYIEHILDIDDFPEACCEMIMVVNMKQDYQLVRKYSHVCQNCGRIMHKYSPGEEQLKCPVCKRGVMAAAEVVEWE